MTKKAELHILDADLERSKVLTRIFKRYGYIHENNSRLSDLYRERVREDGELFNGFPYTGTILLGCRKLVDAGETIAGLREAECFLPVIVYTDNPVRTGDIVTTLGLGATDCLKIPEDWDRIFDSLDAIIANSSELTEGICGTFRSTESLMRLSDRERGVLSLISRGETTEGIARILHLSNRTVEVHRANLLRKLEVKNAVEAAVLYSRSSHRPF